MDEENLYYQSIPISSIPSIPTPISSQKNVSIKGRSGGGGGTNGGGGSSKITKYTPYSSDKRHENPNELNLDQFLAESNKSELRKMTSRMSDGKH